MKVFFDTEFTGLHKGTELISIGLIDERGRTFYAENNFFGNGYHSKQDQEWIEENVLPHLELQGMTTMDKALVEYGDGSNVTAVGPLSAIADAIELWLAGEDKVKMWSDCLAYDWMLFNHIWGHAFKIPKNIYYIPFDLCTLMEMNSIDPDVPREEFAGMKYGAAKHNALWDAKVIKRCYEIIAPGIDT